MALSGEEDDGDIGVGPVVPDTPVARALARILDQQGRHVGFGLLVAPGKVVTCAHVVADSMGEPPTLQMPPQRRRVRLDFPFSAPGRVLTAAVVAWRPMAEDGSGDVAGLDLDDAVPQGVRPHSMARGPGRRGHRVLAYGYQSPDTQRAPTWVPGTVVGQARPGWLQLGLHEHTGGLRIRRGFSGSPVWDEQSGQVVGLVTQAYLPQDMWLAYATGTEVVFDAWPELRNAVHAACPFRMLVPFEAGDRDLFFGRAELATQTLEQVVRSEHTLVTGASGAGKTSLIKAAVVPDLQQQGHEVLQVRLTRDSLWASIAAAIAEQQHPAHGAERMAAEQTLTHELETLGASGGVQKLVELLGNDRLVVIVDQFEDVLHARRDTARQVVAELGRLPSVRRATGGPIARVVIIMRDDKRTDLLALAPFNSTPPAEVVVGPMEEHQLRQAIEEPVRRNGFVHYEEGLVDLIQDEVHVQPYSLPTLQVVLTELWYRQAADGLLRHTVYQELSQGAGPLATHLERVWRSIGEQTRAAARRLFLHLVVPVDSGGFARRIVSRDEVDAQTWSAVDALAGHRLLVLRGTATGDATAELVHDALIEQWRALAEHLAAHRDLLIWRDDLRRLSTAWAQNRRQPGHLLHGAALTQGLMRMRQYASQISPPEQEFLLASRGLRSKRRKQSALAVATVAVLLMSLGVIAWSQRSAASQNERDDLSRRLAAQSQTQLEADPALAALLAASAWKTANTPEARYAMLAVQHSPNRATLTGATGTTHGGAFSPDGTVLATGGGNNDESVRLWDVRARKLLTRLETGQDTVWNVAFSPDGRHLAAACKVHSVVLVDLTTRQQQVLNVPPGSIDTVAFSPDGRLVAGAGGEVHVWNTATGREVIPPIKTPGGSALVTFSKDGRQLITGGADGNVRLWTLTGKPAGKITVSSAAETKDRLLTGLKLSPDGTMLVTADARRRIRIWDMATRRALPGAPTGSNPTLSPDGRILAYNTDKTIRLWDLKGRQTIGSPLAGHVGAVHGIAFSPDGKTLATTSVDTTVRLWDVSAYQQSSAPLVVASGKNLGNRQTPGGALSPPDVPGGVEELAFSPDGRSLATGGADLRVWDLASRRQRWPTLAVADRGDGSSIIFRDVAFSRDGRYLAAVNAGLVDPSMIWDLRTDPPTPRPFTAGGEPLNLGSLAFTPDGQRLVTIDNNGPVRVWETASLRQLDQIPDDIKNVSDIALSSDGRLLATADSAHLTVRLWDLKRRQVIATINTGHTDSVSSLAFAPRAAMLASGGYDPMPRLWDSGTHLPIGTPLQGHTQAVFALAFSPDGTTLATAGLDRTVRLWDVSTRRPIGPPLTGHTGDVTALAFRHDGKLLASGSRDGTVRFWDTTPTADLSATMCRIAGRPLTSAEWRRYTSGQEMPAVCR
ncbi:nSTAND1 domain-containing NTPase [Actinomadura kijaniata]|uniref:nSTAND1 domain-containing NTPase n=1 Tax=Actinomadura kijaniata TaxID=46161 RepID=UPI003F1A8E92